MKHTPVPWETQRNGAAYNIVAEGETRHHMILLNMQYVELDEFEANAQFIVTACNEYQSLKTRNDELAEQLENTSELLDDVLQYLDKLIASSEWGENPLTIAQKVEQALAKAGHNE